MDVSHFKHIIGVLFFIPGEGGGARATSSGMSGSKFATKTLLPWRTDISCLSNVTCVSEKRASVVCVCVKISGSLIPFFLVLLKSVLIFHRWGFYGTDSIHEKSDGHNLIFQVQKCAKRRKKRKTLWTNVSAIFKRADGALRSVKSSAEEATFDGQM